MEQKPSDGPVAEVGGNSQEAKTNIQRQQISAVSSSSIYQFALMAVEEFASTSRFRSPVIEPAGTGMGFKQFCAYAPKRPSDIIFASRQIRPSELALCKKNGAAELRAIQIGYDAIVFVTHKDNVLRSINKSALFKAMGRRVPAANMEWGVNKYSKWNQVDPSLPPVSIEFYAPSINTSSSDAVADVVLVENCVHICCQDLSYSARYAKCKEFREDKRYTIGNDDAKLMVRKLQTNKEAVGIITYNSYIENTDSVKAIAINGVEPTRISIVNGTYNIRRPIWVYIKTDNIANVKGLRDFMEFITDKKIIGKNGLLTRSGLVSVID